MYSNVNIYALLTIRSQGGDSSRGLSFSTLTLQTCSSLTPLVAD
jgi:hypothetical protein